MPYPSDAAPVAGSEAFRSTDAEHSLSQAAILLLLGYQIRADDLALQARADGVADAIQQPAASPLPPEDVDAVQPPRLAPTGQRVSREEVRQILFERDGLSIPAEDQAEPAPLLSEETLAPIAERLYAEESPEAAAALLEASLRHPDPLVRVSAASTYFDLSAEPHRLLTVLQEGTRDPDELVRDVAATALGRIAPEDDALRALIEPGPAGPEGQRSSTTLVIHGTWAKNNSWWQPGGDFFDYLAAGPRPDVYGGADRFSWSGGYSDYARALGASDLLSWVNAKAWPTPPNLITHSHGGSVAMLATTNGLNLNQLVLLSCPVHIPKYVPNFPLIAQPVVSVRVHLDLVILADRGGQRFNLPQIEEHVLPGVWFKHSATHEPPVWIAKNVPAWI